MKNAGRPRKKANEAKREAILDAAKEVFSESGLEGASLRAVASRAGYTPAALYFHFPSKEAIYAALLEESLISLGAAVAGASSDAEGQGRFRAAAMAFFDFYADHPQDLDLGFYLFRGGMKPAGLGRDRDMMLNSALGSALEPIAIAAMEMGLERAAANVIMVEMFGHATGLLLLLHTGRIRMFQASARDLMKSYVAREIRRIQEDEGV